MQTPFDPNTARRSIFRNYRADSEPSAAEVQTDILPVLPADCEQAAQRAMARAFLYRVFAKGFEDPTAEGWQWLGSGEVRRAATSAAAEIESREWPLAEAVESFFEAWKSATFAQFHDAFLAAFGHAARGECALNEIEYGDIKADPLFQPHRLADLAAYYQAFGVELAEDAGERQDHIAIELEFMALLAAKEAFALTGSQSAEAWRICRDAQRTFLREHLARWTPAFTRRLGRFASGSPLSAFAQSLRAFVECECASHQVTPGSEDLLLRPVDDAAESLCTGCGLASPLPGAAPAP